MAECWVRQAGQEDATFLYSLRTDTEAIANSFGPPPADLESHLDWLAECLGFPEHTLLILMEDSTPVGSARLDYRLTDKTAEVSIIIAPQARGRGLGTRFISVLVGFAREGGSMPWLTARVKEENLPSRQAFLNAGFSVEEISDGVVTLGLALR